MSSSPRPNFSDLRDIHKCANDLLHSAQIQQALDLDHHQDKMIMSSVQEISDASLRMLDLCGATRDILFLVKDHFQDLQQIFRRAKIKESDIDSQVSAHGFNRKRLKKGISKCIKDIQGLTKSKYFTSDLSSIDHSLIVVVHVLREVRGASLSILESLNSLIHLPATITISHSQRSIFVSKFMCRGMLLERCDSMEVRMANKRLAEVESAMEELEVELECIIRRLMQTRVLLLNILTS